jgi:XRE family transcriptional regulator, fatty acid utilization regulator
MTKTFVGPQLRQVRRERHQTQAEMAKMLGISAGYVNLLENNERSLSLRLLVALAGQLRRRLAGHRRRQDLESARGAAQRHQGPDVLGNARSDRVERGYRSCAAIGGATFAAFIATRSSAWMRQGRSAMTDRLLATSAEAVVHDFFRNNSNHLHDLEVAAEAMRLEVRPALSARDEVIE